MFLKSTDELSDSSSCFGGGERPSWKGRVGEGVWGVFFSFFRQSKFQLVLKGWGLV